MAERKVTRADFRAALLARFQKAMKREESQVTVRCGDLHDEVGPNGNNHPVCSGVMWVETSEGDCNVLHTPPGGAGPNLTISYRLPRRPSRFGS